VSLTRRSVISAGLAAAAAAGLAGCAGQSSPVWADGQASPGPEGSGAAAGSKPVPTTTSTPSAAASKPRRAASYEAKLTAELRRFLKPTPENPNHPTYAGAVALVMVNGRVDSHVAVGHALRYGAGPVELPEAKRVPMYRDSVFDLASLTKVYASILVLQQVEKGRLDLAAPVARYLPDFTGTGKDKVTVRMLLTHTSGLPVGAKVAGLPDLAAKRKAVLTTPLANGAKPGDAYRYSSVGLMVAAMLVEKVTGKSLDNALKDGISGPLGLRDTGFRPLTWLSAHDQAQRLVATDARSSRGLLRGVVHDDVANQMGGVAGSAGIFATAKDVAAIGQALLAGGAYNGKRILSATTVEQMLTNHNQGLPAIDPDRPGRPSDHGLGVTLRQPWFMGRLSTAATFGHTGFTGTSLLVEPRRKLVLALLTNRAHPNWSWANPDPMRAAIANVIADALP
jgi:CubicO group peptidase (beta-lactamase class C family)